MRKLISFALFIGIVLLSLAAKSADAQVIVNARIAPPCPRPRYYAVRMYRPIVVHPVRHFRGGRVRVRIF